MRILPAIGRAGVHLIDRLLDLWYQPFDFSGASGCILLASRMRAPRTLKLSDGTVVMAGTPLLTVHYKNEILGEWARTDTNVGAAMVSGLRTSFRELAKYLAVHPEFDEVPAIFGELALFPDYRMEQLRRFMEKLGYDLIELDRPGWNLFRGTFWPNIFSWWMMWTFSPRSLNGKRFGDIERCQLWISRERLMALYGPQPSPPKSLTPSRPPSTRGRSGGSNRPEGAG